MSSHTVFKAKISDSLIILIVDWNAGKHRFTYLIRHKAWIKYTPASIKCSNLNI